MKARGNVKKILLMVGEIQDLVGDARGLHWNDRDDNAFALAQNKLEQALNLCVEATSMYDPIDGKGRAT